MKPYDGWSEHNKALKNPEYQMEGMMDCLREETMMNMPVYEEPVREIEPIIPETNFYRQVEYLRTRNIDLQNKLNEHIDGSRKKKKYLYNSATSPQ